MAEEVGQHQVIGYQPGLLGRAAIGPADRHREGVQEVRHHPYFAHATRASGHTRVPPTGTNRAANSAVRGAKSIPVCLRTLHLWAFDPRRFEGQSSSLARRGAAPVDVAHDRQPFEARIGSAKAVGEPQKN
jgi:hypothetical protein